MKREVQSRYADILGTPDYTRIVSQSQYERLRGYLDDARARGLEVIELVTPRDAMQAQEERLLPPTLVIEPDDQARIMQEEIFGPLLPVKSYDSFDAAIDYINAHDRPLALYLFGNDRAKTQHLLERTVAGGVCINETLLHYACSNLPFGGVGASGMGHYHGYEGFQTFTKAMPVLRQARFTVSDKLKPPYQGLPAKIIGFLLR